MTIKRYGAEGGKGTGGQHLPFARAVEAGGWLYVSGQVPMVNGEVVAGNIEVQAHQAIQIWWLPSKKRATVPSTLCAAASGSTTRAIFSHSIKFSENILARTRRRGRAWFRAW